MAKLEEKKSQRYRSPTWDDCGIISFKITASFALTMGLVRKPFIPAA